MNHECNHGLQRLHGRFHSAAAIEFSLSSCCLNVESLYVVLCDIKVKFVASYWPGAPHGALCATCHGLPVLLRFVLNIAQSIALLCKYAISSMLCKLKAVPSPCITASQQTYVEQKRIQLAFMCPSRQYPRALRY